MVIKTPPSIAINSYTIPANNVRVIGWLNRRDEMGSFVAYVPLERAKPLVDAINNAKTKEEHREANLVMKGYQMRCEELGQRWPGIDLDLSLPDDGRPACCGVYLDWEPAQ